MNNGAYQKYSAEVNATKKPIVSYKEDSIFDHELSTAEIVICAVTIALVCYAVIKMFIDKPKPDDKTNQLD